MELQLAIFLALLVLVLAWNAVLLWILRRMLARVVGQLDQNRVWYAHLGDTLRMSIRVAEATTTHMASLSGQLGEVVAELSDAVGRADNWARYGLAKLDFNGERASQKLTGKTRRFGRDLGEQLYRTAVVVHGLKNVLGLIVRLKVGGPHPVRRLITPTPVDTVLTVIEAVTALGQLFAPRPGRVNADRITPYE